MAARHRTLLIILGSLLALIVIAVVAIPLFLNADNFRARIENELTTSLGRKVTLGKLDLSVWSGSLVAQNATLADDPAFSNQPFLEASTVKINVAMMPLILSRQVHITGFAIDSPKINLIRHANGTWNYSTIGAASSKQPSAESSSSMTGVTVGHVNVTNGQLTVNTESAPWGPRDSQANLRPGKSRSQRLRLLQAIPLHRLCPPSRRRNCLPQRKRRPHQPRRCLTHSLRSQALRQAYRPRRRWLPRTGCRNHRHDQRHRCGSHMERKTAPRSQSHRRHTKPSTSYAREHRRPPNPAKSTGQQ